MNSAAYLNRHWPSVADVPDGVDLFDEYPVHYPKGERVKPTQVAHIYVDGKGYQGEDVNRSAGRGDGTPGHVSLPTQLDALVFGAEAYDVVSTANIESHVKRILTHLRHGHIKAHRIEIELREEPAGYKSPHSLVHGWEDA